MIGLNEFKELLSESTFFVNVYKSAKQKMASLASKVYLIHLLILFAVVD